MDLFATQTTRLIRLKNLYHLEHLVETETVRFGEVPERADQRQSTWSRYLAERFQMMH